MAKFEEEIQTLEEKGIISKSTAENIRQYYANSEDLDKGTNRLLLAFGILGAILIGLGIILIVAHNWDSFGKVTRLCFAFAPLLIAQALVFIAQFYKKGHSGWTEVSAILLVMAIGACISMVSQIYNIEGELGAFLLTWCLLALPIPYLTKSNISSLLFIGLTTWLGLETGYINYKSLRAFSYWALLLAILPFYYQLYKNKPKSNAFNFHSWAIAFSILAMLGSWTDRTEALMLLAYLGLLSCYYWIGESNFFKPKRTISNPFRVIAHIGIIGMALTLTFHDNLRDLVIRNNPFQTTEFWIALLLIALSLFLALRVFMHRNFSLIGYMAIAFAVIFLIIQYDPFIAAVLMNLLTLAIGIQEIVLGNQRHSLSKINLGLLVISFLVFARFMDTDMSFVVRGILFLLVGSGFFLANYLFLKKRKSES